MARPVPGRDVVRQTHQTVSPRVSPSRRGALARVGRKPDYASIGEESVTENRYNATILLVDVLTMYSRCAHGTYSGGIGGAWVCASRAHPLSRPTLSCHLVRVPVREGPTAALVPMRPRLNGACGGALCTWARCAGCGAVRPVVVESLPDAPGQPHLSLKGSRILMARSPWPQGRNDQLRQRKRDRQSAGPITRNTIIIDRCR